MNPLEPIPMPPRRRWREFRQQFLPLFVFCGAVFGIVLLWGEVTPTTVEASRPPATNNPPEGEFARELPISPPKRTGLEAVKVSLLPR